MIRHRDIWVSTGHKGILGIMSCLFCGMDAEKKWLSHVLVEIRRLEHLERKKVMTRMRLYW